MATKWKQMAYFAFSLANQPGELARFCDGMDEHGIDLLGLWGYDASEAAPRVSCVPASPRKFKSWAKKAGLEAEEGVTFHGVGADKPGALRKTLRKIAEQGINVDSIECVAAGSKFGCFLWVGEADAPRVKKMLK